MTRGGVGRNVEQDRERVKKRYSRRWAIWGIMALAFMVVFFHRLAVGVVRDDLVASFGLSDGAFGTLASMYFFAYMLMQIPVGMLADSLGARVIVSAGVALSGVGSLLFAFAPSEAWLYPARFLVGLSVATVFVSILKIISQWFLPEEFATMTGYTNFLGNLGGLLAQTPLAWLVVLFTWRGTFAGIGVFSLVLAFCCYRIIRNAPEDAGLPPLVEGGGKGGGAKDLLPALAEVLRSRGLFAASMVNAMFVGTYFALAGAWGVPFLKAVYGFDKARAANHVVLLILGAMFGGIILGWLSDRLGRRRPPILFFGGLYLVLWALLIFWPGGRLPEGILKPYLFTMGFSCMSFAISFAVVKEINAPRFAGMAVSVLNVWGFLSMALLSPAIGALLDRFSAGAPLEIAYQRSFWVCFLAVAAGFVCAFFVPETRCRNVYVAGVSAPPR